MKHKLIFSSIVVIIALFFFGWYFLSGWFLEPVPTHIESGFSNKMVTMLVENYDLQIPKEATFVDGYFTNGFRDQYILFVFQLDVSDYGSSEDTDLWEAMDNAVSSMSVKVGVYGKQQTKPITEKWVIERFWKDFHCDCVGYYAYGGERWAYLLHTEPVDNMITFCFVGHRPDTTFN